MFSITYTLVNVYVDLVVFTHIAGTLKTGSGRYWRLYYVEKHAICLKDYRIRSFLSTRHAEGDLCKLSGIDSSTDLNDRYSNLFLNAYINRHAHTEYLKMIHVYSPLGIWHVFLYSINTNMKHRQYA